jgi:hypothetical protein
MCFRPKFQQANNDLWSKDNVLIFALKISIVRFENHGSIKNGNKISSVEQNKTSLRKTELTWFTSSIFF